MTEKTSLSWEKVLTIAGGVAIPLASIFFWLITSGTHLVDKVEEISTKQTEQEHKIESINSKLDHVSSRVDTLALQFNDYQRYHQRTFSVRITR